MAKKLLNRLGIKTRKQKIEDERKRQQRLEAQEAANANRKWQETSTGDEKFLAGRTKVGDFKSIKAKTGVKDSGYGTQKYKSGDEFYDTKDTSDQMSKREKRIANRQLAKEGRKNRRAEKVADRKGMSNQQAKDFMQNRRDRFRQMSTNFVKGLAGLPMDTKVDKRLMRKDGSGVLQNQIGEDGRVFDATAPFKGSVEKGFSDRGGTRDEVDTYMDLLRDNQATNPDNKVVPIEIKDDPEVVKRNNENKNPAKTPKVPHIPPTAPSKVEISGGTQMTDQINSTLARGTVTSDEQMKTRLKNIEKMNKLPWQGADSSSDNQGFDWGKLTGVARNVGLSSIPGIGSAVGVAKAMKNIQAALSKDKK